MLVKELQAVADIWCLAADDPGTKLIALTLDPLSASFAGTHCEAVAGVLGEERISLPGERLLGALSLLPEDAELQMRMGQEGFLRLGAKGRMFDLTCVAEGAGVSQGAQGIEAPKQFVIEPAPLLSALTFLQECAATGGGRPVLTGVSVAQDKTGGLLLVATDAETHTGMARVKARLVGKPITGEVVVPTKEICAFLSLAMRLEAEEVTVSFAPEGARLAFDGAVMRVTAFQGGYPNLRTLRKPSQYTHKATVDLAALVDAAKASVLLDNDRLMKLTIKNGRAVITVRGQETGVFRSAIPGAMEIGGDAEMVFDVYYAQPIHHLGASATLHYVDGRTSALFVGENGYRFWMALVVAQ